jgi:hypothetical protein
MATLGPELGTSLRALARGLGATRTWIVTVDGLERVLSGLGDGNRAGTDGDLDGAGVVRRELLDAANELCDVKAWGKACREPAEVAKRSGLRGSDPARRNQLLVVDVSAVSCCGCAAVRWGAHLAVDDLSLVWEPGAGRPGLRVVGISRDAERTRPGIGTALDAAQAACIDEGWLDAEARVALAHGVETLGERLRRRFDAAAAVAAFLSCHPRVAAVRYPGLADDACHETGAEILNGGFGPQVAYWASGADGMAGTAGALGAVGVVGTVGTVGASGSWGASGASDTSVPTRILVGDGDNPRTICEELERQLSQQH